MMFLPQHGILQVRAWIVIATAALYVLVFFLLYPTRGASVAALSVLPVILAGWWFGLRIALLLSVLFFLLNTILLSWAGGTTWTEALLHGGPGSLALFVVGAVVGRLHDLDQLLKHELRDRIRAEEALRQHRDHLEELVAERTLELQTANTQLQNEIRGRQKIEDHLQEALEEANALNTLKSRFSSMVSHEFRTPLAIIQSSCDLLRMQMDEPNNERATKRLDKIQIQIEHMIRLLDDILVIGRAETVGINFDPELTNLSQCCQELVDEVQQTTNSHHILFSAEAKEIRTLTDFALLHQAITNLLSNAVKYSPQKSCIYVRLWAEDEHAWISVQDEGIGIPDDDQRELFEVFHRAKNVGAIQGTGLGLTIVKQAVDAHGGTISVKSILNTGTTVTIGLPIRTVSI